MTASQHWLPHISHESLQWQLCIWFYSAAENNIGEMLIKIIYWDGCLLMWVFLGNLQELIRQTGLLCKASWIMINWNNAIRTCSWMSQANITVFYSENAILFTKSNIDSSQTKTRLMILYHRRLETLIHMPCNVLNTHHAWDRIVSF